MRNLLIAGNWKMYKTVSESLETVKKLYNKVKNISTIEIAVCPPFTALKPVSEFLKQTNIKLGAQNLFWEDEGAYTGEISPVMLKDAGCEYVIIGHSERREYFGETDEKVNKKIKSALKHNLKPIVCVGEKLEEREKGITEKILEIQITNGLKNLSKTEIKFVVIAYEPVWAIGTGKTATPEIANSAQKFIRDKIEEMFGKDISENIRILYGGSVKPENAKSLLQQEHIDGALVGGASLDADKFAQIIEAGL
jgi:triosephosphate isomerase